MRQFAECGYCARALCDAFEVDHLNERRTDDRANNLVATCALCHAIKSRHVRMRRDWSEMRSALAINLARTLDRWRGGAGWGELPDWLQARVHRRDASLYEVTLRPVPTGLDLERFRYVPSRRARRDTR